MNREPTNEDARRYPRDILEVYVAKHCFGYDETLGLAQESSAFPGLTHQELADSVGLYRETVTKVLNRLQAQGLLELGKKKIVIVDREKLEEIAQI